MAKKKEWNIENERRVFKSIISRAGFGEYRTSDGIIIAGQKELSILIKPECNLLGSLIIDDSPDKLIMEDIDISTDEGVEYSKLLKYAIREDLPWISLTDDDRLYKGEVLKITLQTHTYEIPINKDLIPVKLNKSEFCDISYCVFPESIPILGIKKYFTPKIEGCGFSMIRLFKII